MGLNRIHGYGMSNRRMPRRSIVCRKCGHGFTQTMNRERVRCPQCSNWDDLRLCEVFGERKEEVAKQAKERKKANTILHNPESAPDQVTKTVRGSKIPHVKVEADFKNRAEQLGYKVHRPSWPDYILEKDNKLLYVEVKSERDDVSPEQEMTFDLLEKYGTPVYVWKKSKHTKKKLYRWGDGVEAKKIVGTYRLIRKGAAERARIRSKEK